MTATHSISVDVQTPDGVADAYVAYPDDGAAHPGVLVIQDGFGLRCAVRRSDVSPAQPGRTRKGVLGSDD
jgi:dienelactone hydrolase